MRRAPPARRPRAAQRPDAASLPRDGAATTRGRRRRDARRGARRFGARGRDAYTWLVSSASTPTGLVDALLERGLQPDTLDAVVRRDDPRARAARHRRSRGAEERERRGRARRLGDRVALVRLQRGADRARARGLPGALRPLEGRPRRRPLRCASRRRDRGQRRRALLRERHLPARRERRRARARPRRLSRARARAGTRRCGAGRRRSSSRRARCRGRSSSASGSEPSRRCTRF